MSDRIPDPEQDPTADQGPAPKRKRRLWPWAAAALLSGAAGTGVVFHVLLDRQDDMERVGYDATPPPLTDAQKSEITIGLGLLGGSAVLFAGSAVVAIAEAAPPRVVLGNPPEAAAGPPQP